MDSIIAENVVRRHHTGRGIEGVSLSVRAGRCLGVLGPNGSGRTAFIADNDVDWLSRAATDVILLREGRLEAGGPVLELMASVGVRSRIDILLEQVGFDDVPHLRGIDEFRREGNRVSAEFNGDPELPAQLLRWLTAHGGRVRSMEIRSVTLHEALMRRAAQQKGQS